MKKILFVQILFLWVLSSCTPDEEIDDMVVEGFKPVYAQLDYIHNVYASDPIPVAEAGKIYYKHPYIYVVEKGVGVHVYDNSNPTNPTNLKFINIPGNQDVAVKSNTLYADNFRDLIAIDISNIHDVTVTERFENVYEQVDQYYPSSEGYFECVNPEMGYVVSWVEAELVNPKCRRE